MQIISDTRWLLKSKINHLASEAIDNLNPENFINYARGCTLSPGVRKLIDEMDSEWMIGEIFEHQKPVISLLRGFPIFEDESNEKIFHQIKTRWGATTQVWEFRRLKDVVLLYFISQTRGPIFIRLFDGIDEEIINKMNEFGFDHGTAVTFWCMYDLGWPAYIAPIIILPCET